MTDLRRYRRERERARRKPAGRPPSAPREPLLGSRPRAGLLLALVVLALVLLWLLPRVH